MKFFSRKPQKELHAHVVQNGVPVCYGPFTADEIYGFGLLMNGAANVSVFQSVHTSKPDPGFPCRHGKPQENK